MRRILVCRHGQDEDNAENLLNGHRDRPLTELGRAQAATIAQLIAESHPDIDHILCSPLQRAHHTAIEIGTRLGKEPTPVRHLIERDFGVLSGQPLADISKHATQFHDTEKVKYFLDGEGVETFEECMARAAQLLDDLHNRYTDKVVLLVCHGDIAKMLLAAHRRMHWREALDTPYIPNTGVLEL